MTTQRAWKIFIGSLRKRQWWSLFILALVIWIIEGLVAAGIQGNVPRISHLYKAFFSFAAVVGYRVLPTFNRAFWKRMVLGVLLGGLLSSGAGFMQYKRGSFPLETMLMSSFEKSDKRHYRGQLYIPGTKKKAATGLLRNRIKTSVTLLWVFALLVGLTPLITTGAARLGLLVLGGVFSAFSALTFAKAGLGAALLCLVGVIVLQSVPAFRRVVGLTLGIAFVVGMGFVMMTGANYAQGAKAPIALDKVSIRGFAWSHGLKVVQEYPVFGAGLGTYPNVSPDVFIDSELAWSYTINAHCQHLTAMAEGGPTGFLVWGVILTLIGFSIQRSWTIHRHEFDSEFQALRLMATYFLVAVFLLSFVHDALCHPSVAALFWVIVGLSGYLALDPETDKLDSIS